MLLQHLPIFVLHLLGMFFLYVLNCTKKMTIILHEKQLVLQRKLNKEVIYKL
jgi:hypothetical protein